MKDRTFVLIALGYTVLAIALWVVLALAVLLTGCNASGWRAPAGLNPIGPPGWERQVKSAADEWNEALASRGCVRPFRIGGDYVVKVHEAEHWPYARDVNGMAYMGGWSWRGFRYIRARVDVLADRETHATLLHELGHAIGLDHVKRGPSVMTVHISARRLERADLDAAVKVLRCGR